MNKCTQNSKNILEHNAYSFLTNKHPSRQLHIQS